MVMYSVRVMPTRATMVSEEIRHGGTLGKVNDIDVVLPRGSRIEKEEQGTLEGRIVAQHYSTTTSDNDY